MKKIIRSAIAARKKAYAPYSKFKVGAAIETKDGRIYTGCNVENASYGLSICAERVAVTKAVSEGAKRFKRIVIVTKNATTPCGACRQFLMEFNPDLEIIFADPKGRSNKTTLSKLLPRAFNL